RSGCDAARQSSRSYGHVAAEAAGGANHQLHCDRASARLRQGGWTSRNGQPGRIALRLARREIEAGNAGVPIKTSRAFQILIGVPKGAIVNRIETNRAVIAPAKGAVRGRTNTARKLRSGSGDHGFLRFQGAQRVGGDTPGVSKAGEN